MAAAAAMNDNTLISFFISDICYSTVFTQRTEFAEMRVVLRVSVSIVIMGEPSALAADLVILA
jgi:uncharacterized membrane protein YhhN